MYQEVEGTPLLVNAFEKPFHLPRRADVKRHHDLSLKRVGQRLDKFLCLVVEVSHGQLGSERPKCSSTSPGDRILVSDANYNAPLASKELSLCRRDKGRAPRYFDFDFLA